MSLATFADSEFALGFCATCGRDVLTHVHYDGAADVLLCVHCDGPITGPSRVANGRELQEDGYREIQPAAGCGVGGCGSGGACRRM